MNIGLFFPKVFTLARDSFNINGTKFNNFYVHDFGAKVALIALPILALVAITVYIYISKKAALVAFAGIVIANVCFYYFSFNSATDYGALANDNNGFSVAQTSFQVRPNKIATGEDMDDYLCENPKAKPSTTDNYQIYARVYHGKSYRTYLFGTMKNGRITASTHNPDYAKIATTNMLTALDSYATYIKKHHLESDFKDSAKLELSDKYLDQDYRPMLIMKGKDGQILRVKEQTLATAKNVVLIKSK